MLISLYGEEAPDRDGGIDPIFVIVALLWWSAVMIGGLLQALGRRASAILYIVASAPPLVLAVLLRSSGLATAGFFLVCLSIVAHFGAPEVET